MNDKTQQYSLSDLTVDIKASVMADLHCMMPAYFVRVVSAFDYNLGYGIISVRPIPLQKGQATYTIYAYVLTNEEYRQNDLLVIGFADLEFSKNLNVPTKTQTATESENMHSMMSAVVINSHYSPRILTSAPTTTTPGYIGEIVYVIEGDD